jgi:hypothetical protein
MTPYIGSPLHTAMTTFYGTISTTAGAFVVNSDADTVERQVSTPMQGSTKAFALSNQEATRYLSGTTQISSDNWNKLNDKTVRSTWLRSNNGSYNDRIMTNGQIQGLTGVGNTQGVRPAMWVKADIFAPDTTTP